MLGTLAATVLTRERTELFGVLLCSLHHLGDSVGGSKGLQRNGKMTSVSLV